MRPFWPVAKGWPSKAKCARILKALFSPVLGQSWKNKVSWKQIRLEGCQFSRLAQTECRTDAVFRCEGEPADLPFLKWRYVNGPSGLAISLSNRKEIDDSDHLLTKAYEIRRLPPSPNANKRKWESPRLEMLFQLAICICFLFSPHSLHPHQSNGSLDHYRRCCWGGFA